MDSLDDVRGEAATPADPKPRIWHLAALFAASETLPLVLSLATLAALAAAGLLGGPGRDLTREHARELFETPEGTLIAMACMAVVCLVLAVAVGLGSREPFERRLRTGRGLFSSWDIVLASLGGLALSSSLGTVLRFLPGYQSGGLGQFHRLCAGLDGVQLWLAVGLIGILAPVGEELFYRGAMQTRLMERFGVRTGLVATSVVFGLAHLDPLHIVVGVAMGLYLGWISNLARSCRTTIAVHSVNNTFAVLVAVLAGQSHRAAPVHAPSDFVASGATALVIAAGCALWLWRRSSRRASLLALRQTEFAAHVA